MIQRVIAEVFVGSAVLVGLLVASPTAAQTTTPSSEKPETSCNTSAAATSGSAGQTANSMAMEKSAILPSAGGHANSAAPTVQSGGTPMKVRPDCPPDSKAK
jgi:hypothetical protein